MRDGRTYRALITPDLWGAPTVLMCWGSAYSRAGGIQIETYASITEALERLRGIAERRMRRDYQPVATIP